MAKLYELIANVKYKGKPHIIGEKIEIDDKDLEFFRIRKLIKETAQSKQPLEKMSLDELKELAKDAGIEGFEDMKKAELLKALGE